MRRKLILSNTGTRKNGIQGETPAIAALENVSATLQDLALQIDNTMDDNCIVAKLRMMSEAEQMIDPADVVDLLNQVRDWVLHANLIVASARSQISKSGKRRA